MSLSKRIASNTFYMMLDAYLGRLVAMVAIIVVQRRLGLDQFGIFSFARAFPAFFIMIADMGLEGVSIREISVNRESTKKYLAKIIPLKLLLMIVSTLFVMGALMISGKDSFTFKVTLILTASIIGRTLLSFFLAVFKGHEKMSLVALVRVSEAIFTFLLVIILVHQGSMADSAAWAMLFSMFATIAFCFYFLIKIFGGFPSLSADVPFCKSIISQSWPLALGAVSVQIFSSTDIVMLSFFKTNTIVGIYASCSLVLNIVSHSQNAISHAIFPVISRFFVHEKKSLPITYEKAFKIYSIVGLPICIGGMALAAPILKALFDISSTEATQVFILICISRIFTVFGAFYGTFTVSIHKQKFFGITYSACAILNILLNLLLIPPMGMNGAAIATIITNFLIIIITYIFTLRIYDKFPSGIFLLKLSCSLATMAAVIYGLHFLPPIILASLPSPAARFSPSILELIISIPVGFAAYLVSFVVFKPFSDDDVAIFKKTFSFAKRP